MNVGLVRPLISVLSVDVVKHMRHRLTWSFVNVLITQILPFSSR